MYRALQQPTFEYKTDLEDRDAHPCKVLSKAYRAKPKGAAVVNVKPSIALACLQSVPLDEKRNLALLQYITPFVQFQSTLEVLANPPETYLFPGVDVLGGLKVMEKKLQNHEYKTQYEFMTDLRSIFAASNDNHFDYTPALLHLLQFARPDLKLISLSEDGIQIPQVFMFEDIARGNQGKLSYTPSAIVTIDGTPITEWLENDAIYSSGNFQDPDAQFNSLFGSLQSLASGASGRSTYSFWDTPDSYTVKFKNGTRQTIENGIVFSGSANFTDIESGEDVHNNFEIPPSSVPDENEMGQTEMAEASRTSSDIKTPTGFPKAIAKHSLGNIGGYFLEDDGYKDTAVLSIAGFVPLEFNDDFNSTSFILEARSVVVELFKKAQKDGRDKLIIDLSANGGGLVNLADEIYRLIFPDGDLSAFNRYRANDALKVLSEVDYDALNENLITKSSFYPINAAGEHVKSGKEWFGPHIAGKQNVTEAVINDFHEPLIDGTNFYYNGVNKKYTVLDKAVFKPENILIITDGTCASACTIFTGYLTRSHNIRTLAFGGRHLHEAMQAMGGVRGSRLTQNSAILTAVSTVIEGVKENDKEGKKLIKAARDVLPSSQDSPLLPLIKGESGGKINSLNAYGRDDLDGYPLHFQYQAANCRLFYTQGMTKDVVEQWRRAYGVAWNKERCVKGSTTNADGTMGNDTVKYSSRVRSRASPMANPGALSTNKHPIPPKTPTNSSCTSTSTPMPPPSHTAHSDAPKTLVLSATGLTCLMLFVGGLFAI
ncbi:hypothetical protein BGZ63DRAFT_351920 [Mariannaea sp. PMI_226]|nr:hypothetical protein BGZ63DRAFT_351920 [Mariannaea sp. PMI_226]